MPALITPPPLVRPLASVRSAGDSTRSDPSKGEQARFVVLEEAPSPQAPPTAAALAAMSAMGGKPAVASRMETRRLERKRRQGAEEPEAEEVSESSEEVAPPVTPMLGRPRINLDAEMEALRKARKPGRSVGPLSAFIAQQFGQSMGIAASLRAPLQWLIAAYVRHQAPEKPLPKRQTLTVS